MKRLIIICLFITQVIFGQNTHEASAIIDSTYNQLIKHNGSMIDFEYLFENDAHKMAKPINGTIGLFSDNKFYLEFTPSHQNKVIQIYDGNALFTILPEEKEIQIEDMVSSEKIFIQDVLSNYKNDFTARLKNAHNNKAVIELKPKTKYNDSVFNYCIDQLELPQCLKLPKQCKIGISSKNKIKLELCLDENGGYQENNILQIELIINNNNLESITQLNRYNGKTSIKVKKIQAGKPQVLNIQKLPYKDFEIIDLR